MKELLEGLADLVVELLALEEIFSVIVFALAIVFVLVYAISLAWH